MADVVQNAVNEANRKIVEDNKLKLALEPKIELPKDESEVEKALDAKPSTLALLTLALIAYAVLELVEAVGLWLLTRWGEYFAVIATSVFFGIYLFALDSMLLAIFSWILRKFGVA